MLTINIIHGNADGSLVLEVNGHPNNGKSEAEKDEKVHWKVKKGCNVEYIHAIEMKTGKGSPVNTDIFSAHPPKRVLFSGHRHWKGKINEDAVVGDEYIYYIEWALEGSTEIQTYDPIISVKPSNNTLYTILIGLILSLLALFSLNYLFQKRKKA